MSRSSILGACLLLILDGACSSPQPEAREPDSSGSVLRGRVLDQDEQPVGHCPLWLLRETLAEQQQPGVTRSYLVYQDEENLIASAETDGDGRFHFERVPAGRVWVGPAPVRKDSDPADENGVAPVAVVVEIPAGAMEQECAISSSRGLFLRGVVKKPDGSPAGKRFVTGFGIDIPGMPTTWSDDRGAFALGPLAPGKLYLNAIGSPEFLQTSAGPFDAGRVDVDLVLEAGTRISGRVVDAEDRPVADAQVGTFWSFDNGPPGSPFHGVACDSSGRFDGPIDAQEQGFRLVAYSSDRRLAGLVEVAKGASTTELLVRVGPSIRVHGRIGSESLGRDVPWTNTYWSLVPGDHRLAQCSSREAKFDVRLPAGSYEWDAYGQDVTGRKGKITLSAETPDVDLGEIDLPATFLALRRGKELPEWKVTAARGVAIEKSSLADFKGKWLLVEFWGYW